MTPAAFSRCSRKNRDREPALPSARPPTTCTRPRHRCRWRTVEVRIVDRRAVTVAPTCTLTSLCTRVRRQPCAPSTGPDRAIVASGEQVEVRIVRSPAPSRDADLHLDFVVHQEPAASRARLHHVDQPRHRCRGNRSRCINDRHSAVTVAPTHLDFVAPGTKVASCAPPTTWTRPRHRCQWRTGRGAYRSTVTARHRGADLHTTPVVHRNEAASRARPPPRDRPRHRCQWRTGRGAYRSSPQRRHRGAGLHLDFVVHQEPGRRPGFPPW